MHEQMSAKLQQIRDFCRSKIVEIANNSPGITCEIGPGNCDLDMAQLFPSYFSVDRDPDIKATYTIDILDICDKLRGHNTSAHTIIMFNTLEHVKEIWKVPKMLRFLLTPDAPCNVHIVTPWDFFLHDPKPDCWRISPDGFKVLFSDSCWTIKNVQSVGPNEHPYAFYHQIGTVR